MMAQIPGRESLVREIVLDTTGWCNRDDLYDALLPALEAPEWHGRNLDALDDSIVGGLNGVVRPYRIRLLGTASLPADLRQYLQKVIEVFESNDVAVGLDELR
jgi:ribonuclease inhibitor